MYTVRMPYREGASPRSPIADAEGAAIRELVVRTRWMRAIVITVVTLAGVLGGALLYDVLSTWQLEHRGAHVPYVTGVVSFLPTFGLALKLAPYVARGVLRSFMPGWRRALAKRHGLDAAVFADVTSLSGG